MHVHALPPNNNSGFTHVNTFQFTLSTQCAYEFAMHALALVLSIIAVYTHPIANACHATIYYKHAIFIV